MTEKDKANMQETIDFITKTPLLNTPENLTKLDAIIYHKDSIEIGGVKRARENRKSKAFTLKQNKSEPNLMEYKEDSRDTNEAKLKPRIYTRSETGETYFNFNAAKQEAEEMQKQGMDLPSKEDIKQSMKTLPGYDADKNDNQEGTEWYVGGNILGLILGLSSETPTKYTGHCASGGVLIFTNTNSCFWSSSEFESTNAWEFNCSKEGGILDTSHRGNCFPLRPVLK